MRIGKLNIHRCLSDRNAFFVRLSIDSSQFQSFEESKVTTFRQFLKMSRHIVRVMFTKVILIKEVIWVCIHGAVNVFVL